MRTELKILLIIVALPMMAMECPRGGARPTQTVPNVTHLSFEDAISVLGANGLEVGEVTATVQRTDPAVQVLTQNPPAGSNVSKGAHVRLQISLPPDPDKFFTLVNTRTVESEASALAYYAAVDPLSERTTLADWLSVNGFERPGGVKAKANYFNEFDLGFGRQILMRRDGDRIAFATLNHPTVDDTWQDKDNPIAAVCMELSSSPVVGGDPFIKFFTFDDTGNRVTKIDLDGRGEKYQPGLCNSCHGGEPARYIDGAYPNIGDVGARFIPFDLESFLYSEINPEFSRAAQEDDLKVMNQAVLDSYDVVRRHRVSYTGPGVAIPSADRVDIPLAVSGMRGRISDLNLSFDGLGPGSADAGDTKNGLTHDFVGSLEIQLTSPSGTSVFLLYAGTGNSGNNMFNVVFDDEALTSFEFAGPSEAPFSGVWAPSEPMTLFDGEDPNGTWKLSISDLSVGEAGSVQQWSLDFRLIGDERTAAEELIQGWYGGPTLPSRFNDDFIPYQWQGLGPNGISDELYNTVLKRYCRNCHVQFTDRISQFDFSTFAKFENAKASILAHVYEQGSMPAALRTFENFWLSAFPSASEVLADYLEHGSSGPGRPTANAGLDRTVAIGDVVTLDGSGSLFADEFFWNFDSVPAGSRSILLNPTSSSPAFTPDVAGEYVLSLSVARAGEDVSAADFVTITAGAVGTLKSFRRDVLPIVQSVCITCHKKDSPVDPGGFLLDDSDPDTVYLEVVGEPSTADNPNPRVDLADPENSLILRKPSNSIPHRGGPQPGFDLTGSRENYDIIKQWIAEGARNN